MAGNYKIKAIDFLPVLRIQILLIHIFFWWGLPDPDPDPLEIQIRFLLSSSKNSKKNN
jgi:hypothetical protein